MLGTWFFIYVVLTIIRFFASGYQEDEKGDRGWITAITVPFYAASFIINVYLIWFFYRTTYQFAAQLAPSANINLTRVKAVLLFVSFVRFCN